MPAPPAHSQETIQKAREMYREGKPVRDICAATGMGIGTLYYHLDGFSLPGSAVQRLPRRREVSGEALQPLSPRGRRKLAARLWRAAERQAQKLEFSLAWSFQRKEDRADDLAALKELTKILRELAEFEDNFARAEARREDAASGVEHEAALAVEGRAVYVTRTRSG
jgi:AcrR family transcriptional regulator